MQKLSLSLTAQAFFILQGIHISVSYRTKNVPFLLKLMPIYATLC